MNWYLNNAGAAEGPLDDGAMAELVIVKKVSQDSLIWHPGLEAWHTVGTLSPSWWKPVQSQPAPVIKNPLPAVVSAPTLKTDGPPRRLVGPNAPTTPDKTLPSEPKGSGGLIKRLLGFGRKS